MLKRIAKTDNNSAQLFLRLTLGIVIFPHGAQKALGWFGGPGLTKTLEIFSQSGFSASSTLALIFIEFFGSLLLIVGFLTRIWALAIGITITTCMFLNHIQHGFFMNWFGQQQGEGFEYHLLIIGIALTLFIKGGGKMSVDQKYTPKKRFRSLEHSL